MRGRSSQSSFSVADRHLFTKVFTTMTWPRTGGFGWLQLRPKRVALMIDLHLKFLKPLKLGHSKIWWMVSTVNAGLLLERCIRFVRCEKYISHVETSGAEFVEVWACSLLNNKRFCEGESGLWRLLGVTWMVRKVEDWSESWGAVRKPESAIRTKVLERFDVLLVHLLSEIFSVRISSLTLVLWG